MQWITNATSRADGHRRRALVDVVMVGTGTIASDDPTLTARDVDDDLVFDQPLRVVVGRTSVPQQAKVRSVDAGFEQFTTHDVVAVLKQLWDRDVRSVLIEGGPTLISAAIAAEVVDEVVMYLAPTVLGAGLASINTVLGEPLELSIDEVETLGDDIVIVGRPIKDLTGVTP
jgi:diaminohydroxyphosphoribosylaminopyrimidine deaminase/5-amino-6-(5-phosphoribosylamino)uracil reductase